MMNIAVAMCSVCATGYVATSIWRPGSTMPEKRTAVMLQPTADAADASDAAGDDAEQGGRAVNLDAAFAFFHKLEAAFEAIDLDGDGTITTAEISAALHEVGEEPTEDELATLLQSFDDNNNGTIDFDGEDGRRGVEAAE